MTKLIVLGSSDAIPTREQDNTHIAILARDRTVLVDCGSNPVVRLEQAGIALESVTDIILTHFHPDHVGAVPHLLMTMWLTGRRHPLEIYGLSYTLDRVETMLDLYCWKKWENFFPVIFHRIPEDEMALVLDSKSLRISSSPLNHFVPTMGFRIEFRDEQKILAYCCDTEPGPVNIRLARGADILIHEAAGQAEGHTSAAQAGEIAQQAGVSALYLIHYPTGRFANGDLAAEAQTRFQGQVRLATDFLTIDLE